MESKGNNFGNNKKPEVKKENKLGFSCKLTLDSKKGTGLTLRMGVQSIWNLLMIAKKGSRAFIEETVILILTDLE